MHRFTTASCLAIFILPILAGCASGTPAREQPPLTKGAPSMSLGNFSVSLTVKDLKASQSFYEKLGFRVVGGNAQQNWLVLQNNEASIGLFQGMFDKNMLTFNPGWNRDKQTLAEFEDVRDLQRTLKARGLTLTTTADEASTGPAYITLVDPDGNPILIDQHVPRPVKK